MNETMRLLRKDARRLRALLALWIVILGARVVLVGASGSRHEEAIRRAAAFGELAGVLAALETLMMGLLIARLVHEEPLVGMDAFWLTRPYDRAALFAEKLIFVLVTVVLLPVAADVASMAWFHTGAAAQFAAGSNYLSSHLTFALALFVVAVLTESLGGFVLAIVGAIATLSGAMAILISVAAFQANESDGYGTLVIDPDPTPQVVLLLAFVIGMLSVIAYQYRRRRRAVAAVLAFAALVVPIFVAAVWPWRFAHPQPVPLGEWADRAQARVDQESPVELSGINDEGGNAPSRLVVAHVPIMGMPRDRFVRMAGVRSRLTMPDGTVIRTERAGMARRGSHRGVLGGDMPLAALLGDATVLNAPGYLYDAGTEAWPPIATLTEEQYARYRGRTGRLDATMEFQVMRADTRSLPLRAGAGFGDSTSRLEIVSAQPQTGGYSVEIRTWQAVSLISPESMREYTYVLWNRARGSVLTQRGERPMGTVGIGVRGGGAVTAALPFALRRAGVDVSIGGGGSAFAVRDRVLQFPADGSAAGTPVDAEWLANAELTVLETHYAGVLTRSLTVDAFTIPAAQTN